jgi:hypothetical protein
VVVDRFSLPNTVLVPIVAISDVPDLRISGFNLNFDIGGDGQGPLPTGVTLPASLPDSNRIIARGGEVNALNWFLITVDARDGSLVSSDLLITGNSPALQTDIPIPGDPGQLTGGTVLFQLALRLSPDVGDRIAITMPSELNALPFMTDSLGNALAVRYLGGSIRVTAVPEPGTAWFVGMALLGVGSLGFRRRAPR